MPSRRAPQASRCRARNCSIAPTRRTTRAAATRMQRHQKNEYRVTCTVCEIALGRMDRTGQSRPFVLAIVAAVTRGHHGRVHARGRAHDRDRGDGPRIRGRRRGRDSSSCFIPQPQWSRSHSSVDVVGAHARLGHLVDDVTASVVARARSSRGPTVGRGSRSTVRRIAACARALRRRRANGRASTIKPVDQRDQWPSKRKASARWSARGTRARRATAAASHRRSKGTPPPTYPSVTTRPAYSVARHRRKAALRHHAQQRANHGARGSGTA